MPCILKAHYFGLRHELIVLEKDSRRCNLTTIFFNCKLGQWCSVGKSEDVSVSLQLRSSLERRSEFRKIRFMTISTVLQLPTVYVSLFTLTRLLHLHRQAFSHLFLSVVILCELDGYQDLTHSKITTCSVALTDCGK